MIKNRFISGYSGLRALAVIAVILYHLDPNTFIGGYLGVPIFFVLSGYLVTDHMLRNYDLTGYYHNKSFYLRRCKKLYPPLIAVLWLSAAWIFLLQRNLLAKLAQIVVANLLNVYNFWQIFNGQSYFERFAANASPFTHLWTMSIEGQFYLLWPLVIFLLVHFAHSRKNIFWFLFTASLLSALEMGLLYLLKDNLNRIYYGTDSRFFSLGLGAAMAVIWPIEDLKQNIDRRDGELLDITGFIAFAAMLLLFFNHHMNAQTAFPYCGGMFIFSVLVTVFVAVIAHPGSHWNHWLTNPVFNWIGSRSYGIYLYQFPVMIFFEDKFTDVADHPLLYHVIEVVLILVISELSYRLIERPLSHVSWAKWKSYFSDLISWRQGKYGQKIGFIFASLILIVGSLGIINSVNAKAIDFNKTQLARRIRSNRRQQATDNKALIAKMKKKKAPAESKLVGEARASAKKHPVNRSFMKYGISQVDLQIARKLRVTAIGDSVMAGSSNDLKALMPKAIINAAVARQLNIAFGLLSSYQSQGALANNVLIGLGTNGPFSPGDLQHVLQVVGPHRHVFWINTHVPTRPWQRQVNNLLAKADSANKKLTVIDWYSYSKKHPHWFYQDQTHPTPKGSRYYSAFVVKKMVDYLKRKYE